MNQMVEKLKVLATVGQPFLRIRAFQLGWRCTDWCERIRRSNVDLATDSVFSETQLVSCRNVLIYFNKKLQDRAFALFHESLCHRGFLVLGSKETPDFSAFGKQFEPLVKHERIYRKS